MTTERFFSESTEQSRVKGAITSKYFWSWAKIIAPRAKQHGDRIVYLDLFAGPGRYEDGSKSTPLLVLEKAIADPVMREMLVAVFNDKDPEFTSTLADAIRGLSGIESLRHKPQVFCEEVGTKIVEMFESMKMIPTLIFIDPWGYKGLSLRLVKSVLKHWGCDCIFFFNYNRINMGLSNPLVQEHMEALFGCERTEDLARRLEGLTPDDRELAVVEELVAALEDCGGKYVLPFRFRNERGTRTSHHLVFVSKSFRAYSVMKDIMARESSLHEQGVPSFEYSPADERFPQLFELNRPLEQLGPNLLEAFAGRTLTVEQIYQQHSVGRPYVKKNYKDLLRRLEEQGKVKAAPPAEQRRVATMADNVRVSFPKREE